MSRNYIERRERLVIGITEVSSFALRKFLKLKYKKQSVGIERRGRCYVQRGRSVEQNGCRLKE